MDKEELIRQSNYLTVAGTSGKGKGNTVKKGKSVYSRELGLLAVRSVSSSDVGGILFPEVNFTSSQKHKSGRFTETNFKIDTDGRSPPQGHCRCWCSVAFYPPNHENPRPFWILPIVVVRSSRYQVLTIVETRLPSAPLKISLMNHCFTQVKQKQNDQQVFFFQHIGVFQFIFYIFESNLKKKSTKSKLN